MTTDYPNICMSNFTVHPPESHLAKTSLPRTPFSLPIVLQPYIHVPHISHDYPIMPKSKKTKSTKCLYHLSVNTTTYENNDIGESEVNDNEVEDDGGSNCEGESMSSGLIHIMKVTAALSFMVPQCYWIDTIIPKYQKYLGLTNLSCAVQQSLTDKCKK